MDVRNALVGALSITGALVLAAWLVPGLTLAAWWTAPAVAAVLTVADLLLGPALELLAAGAGAAVAIAAGFLARLVLVQAVLAAGPATTAVPVTTAGAALVLVVVARAAVRSTLGGRAAHLLVEDLASGAGAASSGPDRPTGVVLVQIDGLSFPVLLHGLATGRLPTLRRWLESGTHSAVPWWARVPSTTPASQAGLLHGTSGEIPAFRWYEKDDGRLVVANRPADAATIESRISDGRGLLAGNGVSVSNLFTGDAPTNRVVLSRTPRGVGAGSGREYLHVFGSALVLARMALAGARETARELREGRRQLVRGVEPRVHRGPAWAVVRGLTSALLREVDLALVSHHMMRGAPVLYVTFVDYDELAHHAGVTRPESMAVLADIDRVLAVLEGVAARAPRRYRLLVLSDHGQSQGATFHQLAGRSLEDAVRAHAGLPAPGHRDDGELVVAASGNLGLVWFPGLPGRADLEMLRRRFPALIPGLLEEPGIGFVVARGATGAVAIGSGGTHVLDTGDVRGDDPLAPFGLRAERDLARVARMRNFPDLLVHSSVDQGTEDVHAFEELVGSHGGLGGWQNVAVLVHPADWRVDDDLLDRSVPGEALLYGAEAVHDQLVRWLEQDGLRPAVPSQQGTGR